MLHLYHHVARRTKESFSVKGVIATAVLTMITTGTVNYFGNQALQAEKSYWAKYEKGLEAKDRWWDSYFKSITKNCGD